MTTPAEPTTDTHVPSRQERVLKAIVIGLGVLIVICLAVIVATIAWRATRAAPGRSAAAGTATAAQSGPALEAALALPSGATVRTMSVSGDRLAVHYVSSGGDGIIVVDLRTGQPIARLAIGADQK